MVVEPAAKAVVIAHASVTGDLVVKYVYAEQAQFVVILSGKAY